MLVYVEYITGALSIMEWQEQDIKLTKRHLVVSYIFISKFFIIQLSALKKMYIGILFTIVYLSKTKYNETDTEYLLHFLHYTSS